MESLSTPPNRDVPHAHHGSTLLLGTSPGIRGVHDPAALPFDVVTYLIRAEVARKRMPKASGLFFAFDARLDGDGCDDPIIHHRTERLRQLLRKLLPHFAMRTHRELEATGLASTLERVPSLSDIDDTGLRQYARVQTAQVLHMQEQAHNGRPEPFTKFGWILSRRGDGSPVGGEANFDQFVLKDSGIEFVYTAPAFPLRSSNGKAPYLLHEADRSDRVCLVDHPDQIGAEVAKVQPGITRVMYDTLRITAQAVLSRHSFAHQRLDELAQLPLSKAMKQRVTDPREIDDLRQLLFASLHPLLP